jgi:hypothetical protein
MQIVVFSYNFLPQDDAEAYCTARFVNALAESGHQVHVVTMEHDREVPEDVVDELVSSNVQICRIPKKETDRPIFSRLWYRTTEWNAIDLSKCIQMLKRVLRSYERPILITRSMPAASNIVGWYCRKYAHKWVAHFSDPYPWFRGRWPMNRAQDHWCRRFINDADYCSVTCPDVLQFFNDWNPTVYEKNKSKFVQVPHIGEPLLEPSDHLKFDFTKDPIIAHSGMLHPERYVSEIVSELQKVKTKLSFLQVGWISDSDEQRFRSSEVPFTRFRSTSPRDVSLVYLSVAINLVVDAKTDLDYTPYLPSKFAYLAFTEAPILAYTKQGSAMHRYSIEYKDAGIYFANVNQPGSLSKMVSAILSTNIRNKKYSRAAFRAEFSKKGAISNLMEFLAY